MLDDFVSSARIQLDWIAVTPARTQSRVEKAGALTRTLAAIDRLLFAQRIGTLEPTDVKVWAREHAVPFDELPIDQNASMTWRASQHTHDPNIILDLTGSQQPLLTPRADVAIWRLSGVRISSNDSRHERASVVRAVFAGSPTVTFELEETTGDLSAHRRVTAGVCPTHPSSPLLTNAYLAASAHQLIVRRAKNFRPVSPVSNEASANASKARRADSAVELGGSANTRTSPTQATAGEVPLRDVSRTVARTALRQVRKMMWEQQWFLLVGRQSPHRLLPEPRDLETFLPPAGRYWADPHVVPYEGRVHVFFEEFLYAERRGRIAVTTLDSDCRPGPVKVALELDSHLSYPNVFVRNRRLYMVPEGASSGRVDLYECQGDVTHWSFRRTMLQNTPLVDVSVVEWQGLWWLFGSLKKPPGLRTAELLLLYWTDDPTTGKWREHRLSPLLADVTNARPAGAPWPNGSRLYRLAQDGSAGYGSGIVVNEVLRMDEDAYDERRVASLQPVWDKRLAGAHTLNRAGDVVVMDACRWVPRDPRRQRTDAMLD
jgi:hypothetical protein